MIAIPNDLLAKLMTIAASGYAEHPEESTALHPEDAQLLLNGFSELTPDGIWATEELRTMMDSYTISNRISLLDVHAPLQIGERFRVVGYDIIGIGQPVELFDMNQLVGCGKIKEIRWMLNGYLYLVEVTEVKE